MNQNTEMGGRGREAEAISPMARFGRLFYRFGLILVFIVVFVLFSIINPEIFPTLRNMQLIGSTQATIGFVALAVMTPMIVGQFDLSAGFQFGFAQSLCAVLVLIVDLHPAVAMVCVLVAGMAIGLVNGLLITKLELPSFTTTLGVGIVVLGMTQLITGDQIVLGVADRWFTDLGRDQLMGFPLPFIYLIVCATILGIVLKLTIWGRRCYATGSNMAAARLAGIRVDRVVKQSLVIGSLFSAVAGCISVMILGSSSPTIGLGTLLPAFAGAFLGATVFEPGRYNVPGTILAVYLVGMGITGLQQLGASTYVEQFFNGGALLIAIVLASIAGRRRA